MHGKLFEAQRLLRELEIMIDSQMPEAQRKMEQGDDWDFLKVTAQIEKITAIEALVRDMLVIELGEPDFGMNAALQTEVTNGD
jgi:hypothetical protein